MQGMYCAATAYAGEGTTLLKGVQWVHTEERKTVCVQKPSGKM